MSNHSLNPIDVLLVDDDDADVLLTKKSLENGKLYVTLNTVKDGVEALLYLRRTGQYAAAKRPDLILLDLNMPRMGGHEFLAKLKADEQLKIIPVVVLTTSDADADVVASYELQAACHITKPVDLDQFQKVVQTIKDFWFTVVAYPPE